MTTKAPPSRYSIPPAAVEGFLERYERDRDSLDAPELMVLARTFERTGCDQQALDCADRAAKIDPTSKDEALDVAKRCLARVSKPT